ALTTTRLERWAPCLTRYANPYCAVWRPCVHAIGEARQNTSSWHRPVRAACRVPLSQSRVCIATRPVPFRAADAVRSTDHVRAKARPARWRQHPRGAFRHGCPTLRQQASAPRYAPPDPASQTLHQETIVGVRRPAAGCAERWRSREAGAERLPTGTLAVGTTAV